MGSIAHDFDVVQSAPKSVRRLYGEGAPGCAERDKLDLVRTQRARGGAAKGVVRYKASVLLPLN